MGMMRRHLVRPNGRRQHMRDQRHNQQNTLRSQILTKGEHILLMRFILDWKRFCWPKTLKRRLKNNWLSMEKEKRKVMTDCFPTKFPMVVDAPRRSLDS